MFHHFHGGIHPISQGSIGDVEFRLLLEYVGLDNIVSPETFVKRLYAGTLRPNDVVLSFDDGLRSQYDVALPILEELGIKSLFYIYTSPLRGNYEKLEIYRSFRHYFTQIDTFYDEFEEKASIFTDYGDSIKKCLAEGIPEDYLSSKVYPFYSYRDRVFRYIRCEILGYVTYCQVMDRMIEESSFDVNAIAPTIWMDRDCLIDLKLKGHTLGLHSDTHRLNLASVNCEAQEHEYRLCYETIASIVGTNALDPLSVAYPCEMMNDDTNNIMESMNVKIGWLANACSPYDPLRMPRVDHALALRAMMAKPALGLVDGIEIRSFQNGDWTNVSQFVSDHWSSSHPLLDKCLFDWMYGGFDSVAEHGFLTMWDHQDLIGIFGHIPVLHQIPVDQGMEVVHGGESTMWMVREDYKGRGLGIRLLFAAQERYSSLTHAGSNILTAVPLMIKGGVTMRTMHRYVLPLDAKLYHTLLFEKEKVSICEIEAWLAENDEYDACEPLDVSNSLLKAIEMLWKRVSWPLGLFSLYRNVDFWKWRYVNSCGFKYLFFGDPNREGVVIARLEPIKLFDGLDSTAFRIIEAIPSNIETWNGNADGDFVTLLRRILTWAVNHNAVVADFYCSSSRLAAVFRDAGFREQFVDDDGFRAYPPVCSLRYIFTSMTSGIPTLISTPIPFPTHLYTTVQALNVGSWIKHSRYPWQRMQGIQPSMYDTYMVKSTGDMDRP